MSSSPISSTSLSNPFFAAFATPACAPFGADDDGAVPATAPEGSYTYAMIPSAPAVESSEVESSAIALEITVKWGDSILHVAHLSPARSFSVGERGADFTMPADKLGAERVELVVVDASGKPSVNVGANATGRYTKKGEPARKLSGGDSIALESESRASIEMGAFTFEIASVKAGKKVAGARRWNGRALGFGVLAAAVHAGLFAAMFAFTPALGATDEAGMSADQSASLRQTLQAMAEKEQDEQRSPEARQAASDAAGNEGQRAEGQPGEAGSPTEKRTNGAFAVKKNGAEPSLASMNRADAIAAASDFGMISVLNQMNDKNAVTSPWGTIASGNDPLDANGNMWGDSLANSFGSGGLYLSGDGSGAGAYSDLIGLGNIGTIGHDHGSCAGGPCSGDGHGANFLPGTHHTRAPSTKPGDTKVVGRLPPEVIQRTIRQNLGRARACYEVGLRSNPNLQGRVVVNFVIGADGGVGSATNGGSDLPDPGVVSCVVRAFAGLSFPAPEGGVVTVSYPIALTPAS
jgi:hypothetical protein